VKYFFFFTALLAFSAVSSAGHIYVSAEASAPNAGSSWATTTTMDAALKTAIAGDVIWVKQGTYTVPSQDRSQSFVLPCGVQVYGGFAGSETNLNQRPLGGASILSGDIGIPGDIADNAYTVLIMKSTGLHASVLDGFTITGGHARNFQDGLTAGSAGGGLYIEAAPRGLSTHQISNCRFIGNKAHNGGAIFVDSGRPSFDGCSFASNSADFNGGAIYNYGSGSEASPIFRDCVFTQNNSNSGAGMTNNGTNGASSPLILDCRFVDNVSLINGAAIFNITDGNGICELVMEGCSFEGNNSILGDDVSGNGVSPTIAKRAKQNGGGSLLPSKR